MGSPSFRSGVNSQAIWVGQDFLKICESRPQDADAALEYFGHLYFQRGHYQELWETLENLPPELAIQPNALYWRLMLAHRLDKVEALRALRLEVEAHLAREEAPPLRALYAGILAPYEEMLPQAERAVQAQATPFTLYQYARVLELVSPAQAEIISRKALRLAEEVGWPYDVVRNATYLALQVSFQGRYKEALGLLDFALTEYMRHSLGDMQRWLYTFNDWAYFSMILGETDGLRQGMDRAETYLSKGHAYLRLLVRSTLADWQFVQGHKVNALALYQQNWKESTRLERGWVGKGLVRMLLALRQPEEARQIAVQAWAVTREEHPVHASNGELALGMALTDTPTQALPYLEKAYSFLTQSPGGVLTAQAGLYLAKAHLELGDSRQAKRILEACKPYVQEISYTGLELLCAPLEDFAEVLALLNYGTKLPLKLNFLGQQAVQYAGQPLRLRLSFLQLLALLALHPKGLTLEQLLLLTYGDNGKKATLKAHLSRLRKQIPIASCPYRLEMPLEADFLKLERLLAEGRIGEAVQLYRGPLLPMAEAPGIVEARQALEATLRQAVLSSRNVEATMLLAERLQDDLEVWESALEKLHINDPRRHKVTARVHHLLDEMT